MKDHGLNYPSDYLQWGKDAPWNEKEETEESEEQEKEQEKDEDEG